MPKEEEASLNQTSHPYVIVQCHPALYGYGNFDKQSMAPKQGLVRIRPPIDWLKLNSWHLGLASSGIALGAGTHLLLVLA